MMMMKMMAPRQQMSVRQSSGAVSLRVSTTAPAARSGPPLRMTEPLQWRVTCRSVPRRKVGVAATGPRGGSFDDDDGEERETMEDLEEVESWEAAAGAEEVMYDTEMLQELGIEDESYQEELMDVEEEEELQFATAEERALAEEEREKLRKGRATGRRGDVKVFDYDPDPRMRIMTEDGSRWDKDGIDRIKFAWEKINYEVPEIHDTEEMKRLKAAAEQDKDHSSGRNLREMPPELKAWWKDIVDGGRLSDVYGGTAESWAALDTFYNGLQKSRLDRIETHLFRLQDMGLLLTQEQKKSMTQEQLDQHEKDTVAIQEANADEIAAISDEIEELVDEIEDPMDDYESELRNPNDPTSGYKLTLPDTLERWNALEPYVKQAFPNEPQPSWNVILDTYHNASERLRVVDDPVPEPIPEQEEVKLNTWEMRVRYEHLKAKKQRREAYWKDFEERVGKQMQLEYDCTEMNDVRLRPTDREPRVWTHEEIMNVITENGMNADPEEAMRDSLQVVDPLEPVDHVFDLGVRYVPSMEESIQELGLMMPTWASERIDFDMKDPMSEWQADDEALNDDDVEEELEMELDMYDEFDKLEDDQSSKGTKGTTKTGRKRR